LPYFLIRPAYATINASRNRGIMFHAAILTISDKGSQGSRQDKSGGVIRECLATLDSRVAEYAIVPDEADIIAARLAEWADRGDIDLVLTTGGTGLALRDTTPEATLSILDRVAPGFTEAMRTETFKITPHAILSRAAAGTRKQCLIINLPGSPKAVKECLEVILPTIPHAIEIIKGEVTEHTTPHD